MLTTSPGWSQRGDFPTMPTPGGVPVRMTVPAGNVVLPPSGRFSRRPVQERLLPILPAAGCFLRCRRHILKGPGAKHAVVVRTDGQADIDIAGHRDGF